MPVTLLASYGKTTAFSTRFDRVIVASYPANYLA